jgi:two-component system, cell cycle response regulator DivK
MPVRILVVEDDPADMELMAYVLQAAGHQTLCAHDGEEGLAFARREVPDMLITEIMLPRKDGRALLQELRQYPGLESLPVIALAREGENHLTLLDAGFAEILPKPIDPEALVDTVARVAAGAMPWQLPRRENGNHPDC